MTDLGGAGPRTRGAVRGRHGTSGAGDDRSDGLLTGAVRDGGDATATEELYRRHAPAVLAYARACCRDPHTAEDLVSEAFTRTVRAVRDGKGPTDAWRPYLLAVVRHTAAQWAEQARRVDLSPGFGEWLETSAGRGGAVPDPVSREADGEERVVRAEDGDLIAAAFRALPERWRAVLWHHVVEEEPAAKVGTLLGLTPSGVTSLTARAREGLREAYLAAHAGQGAADDECRRCSDRLAAAVRRSRPRRDGLLERHMERCGRCRRAARELTDLNQRLRTVLPVAVLLFGGPAYLEARAAGAAVGASSTSGHAVGGGPAAGVSAPEMIRAGWLSDSEAVKVTESGTYTLRSLHGEGSGTRALDIPMGEDRLVVEYRHAAGSFDENIEGVHAYRVPKGAYGSSSLIDMTEANRTSGNDAPADADAITSVTDEASKVSVAVVSSGDGRAEVKVALDGEDLSAVVDAPEETETPDPEHTGTDTDAGDKLTEGAETKSGGQKELTGAEGSEGSENSEGSGDLAATGGDSSTLPLAAGGAALVLAGAGALVLMRRRKRA